MFKKNSLFENAVRLLDLFIYFSLSIRNTSAILLNFSLLCMRYERIACTYIIVLSTLVRYWTLKCKDAFV